MADDHQNWNNLLQKLAPKAVPQESKPVDNKGSDLTLSQENNKKIRPGSEIGSNSVEDVHRNSIYESSLSSTMVNYIEDVPELQMKNVRNIVPEERIARTIAVNSRFICYSDENDTLFIKSLKNLSLIDIVQELNSKISDIVFLEDNLSNNLALITANGMLVVYNIDLDQSKDKIIIKEVLKQNLERPSENMQIQWKNFRKIGVAGEKELTIFEFEGVDSHPENSKASKPLSQNSYQFEATITDFAFSPGYPLVYLLLESNVVEIINIDTGSKVKDFVPHKDSIEPVIRILPYKSLVRHEPIHSKGIEGGSLYDETQRDIFLTVTRGFEIKIWDLSEWDSENEAYYCIETFQLNQSNSNFDPNSLIKRCVFYDPWLNFVFLGFKLSDDKGINITALHIDEIYHGYSDNYNTVKKSKKFFNSSQALMIRKNSLTDLSVLNFGDDEIDYYFKKNSYLVMSDLEPGSTRTQDGSYACDSKNVLIFFVHNEDSISVGKVLGDKLYPFALVEELDKITQAEQLETQSTTSKGEGIDSFPPEISGFIKELINENKRQQAISEEGKVREPDYVQSGQKGGNKKPEYSEEISESSYKGNKKEVIPKEDTFSPDAPKSQGPQKKKHGNDRKKEKEGGQGKGQSKGDNQKNLNAPTQANLELALGIEKESQSSKKEDAQFQAIERGLEKRFQEFTDKSIQLLNSKFGKIEEVIEKKVNERVTKLQMDNLNNAIAKQIDDKLPREFSNAFERSITPCFEKYLVKMFEQVSASFEKGQKFYVDKLNIEQAKGHQLKETMNEVIKSFVQISNALAEGLMNNQASFNRAELNIQEKQSQISRLVEQINEILLKQQDVQGRIEEIKKDMQELRVQHQMEIAAFGDFGNKYAQKFGSQPFESKPHDIKKDPYGSNPFSGYQGGQPGHYYANKTGKEKQHPLMEQLPYLEAMTKRPMETSGYSMSRGPGMGYPYAPTNPMYPTTPYQQQLYDYYNNSYQKARASPYPQNPTQPQELNQHANPNPQIANQPNNMVPDFNQKNQSQTPQMNQLPPELQKLFYQQLGQLGQLFNQATKEKEDEKEKSFTHPPHQENSPFLAHLHEKPASNQQPPPMQRTPSQMDNPPFSRNSNQNTPNQTFIQQDQENLDKPTIQLPPGIQASNQAQSNVVQALFENLPQNIQQNFAQGQGLNQQKPNEQFGHGFSLPNNGEVQNTGNPNDRGANIMSYLQSLYPGHVNQNYSNFGGYQGFPPQMANAQINKPGGAIKNPSSLQFNQIPLVDSTFKTPARETNTTADEDSNSNSK